MLQFMSRRSRLRKWSKSPHQKQANLAFCVFTYISMCMYRRDDILRKSFGILDEDKDGLLTEVDLSNAFQRKGLSFKTVEVQHMLQEHNCNGKGFDFEQVRPTDDDSMQAWLLQSKHAKLQLNCFRLSKACMTAHALMYNVTRLS